MKALSWEDAVGKRARVRKGKEAAWIARVIGITPSGKVFMKWSGGYRETIIAADHALLEILPTEGAET